MKRILTLSLALLPALALAHAADHAHSHAALDELLEWLSEPAALAGLVLLLLPGAGVALRQLWLKRQARAGRA